MRHARASHKDVFGSGGIAPKFFTSALDEGERSVCFVRVVYHKNISDQNNCKIE
jgi:hypothetical protein